jgi:High-affinity nickel-transport protein
MPMTAVSVDSLVALGFVLGLRHAIEADHLAAISTIVTERRSLLSSLLVGASWGLGHTLALLVAGVGVLLLRYQMTDRMAHAFGVNPSVETVRLAHLQLFFVPLFFFEEKVIGVDAVENCALCSFPSHLWARSVRPQGRQRPYRLPRCEIFQ